MRPILFQIGAVELPAYLTMIMFGFFAAMIIARRDGESLGLDGVAIVDLGILLLILGVVGARLLAVATDGFLMDFVNLCTDPKQVHPVDTAVRFCAQNSDCGFDYLCNTAAFDAVTEGAQRSMCYPPKDCLAALKFWNGGLTFYGGVLLALPVGLWFAKRRGLSPLRAADLFAPALMLALSFGRVGCFLNGCCYGAQTSSWAGVHFPKLHSALGRHPTQVYESIFALVLFVVLRHVLRKRLPGPGQLFGSMLVCYGLFRIVIELVRDDVRGALGPLSTSQLISIPLIGLGLLALWRGRKIETNQP